MVWGGQRPESISTSWHALRCRSPIGAVCSACAPVAQGIERLPPEQKAAGSNPAGGTTPKTASHQVLWTDLVALPRRAQQ